MRFRDRRHAGEELAEGSDRLVLSDEAQHYRLTRDAEVIEALDRVGAGGVR